MLVSQLGVKAKNYTVKIMTIYYHIKSMEGNFMKPNRRNSLDVRWHRPLERSVTCTCCKEKFSSPFEWPIFRRRNIVTIIRNLKKKGAYARLLGLSTSLTILSVKLISILIVLCAKLVQESSGPRFTSLTVSPEQKISSEDKVNYGLFGDNHLCSVSDLNHSQCHWQQNKQNKLRNWFLWVGCNNNCRREVWKD